MQSLFGWVRDETGAVLSAEAALLGTVGVLGAVVGVNLFAGAVNDELRDVSYSFRSLDQSYSVAGHSSATAWTAGSGFTQEPVDVSLVKLREREEELRAKYAPAVRTDDEGGRDGDEARARNRDREADANRDREEDDRRRDDGRQRGRDDRDSDRDD